MRKGNWLQTYSGGELWPLDPRPAEILPVDIARALSNQCRFAGHVRQFYSVAEHCVLASDCILHGHEPVTSLGPDRSAVHLALAALLHDASEYALVDVPRPIKPALSGYAEIERGMQNAIYEKFGVPSWAWDHPIIHTIDMRLLFTEKRDLLAPAPRPWDGEDRFPPYAFRISPLTPDEACARFTERLAVLYDLAWHLNKA